MRTAGRISLLFQPDFSADVSRLAEKYPGVKYPGKNPGEKFFRVYIEQPKNGDTSGNHWDSFK